MDGVARSCCATLAEVMEGPGAPAEPTILNDGDDILIMVIALLRTPEGLGMIDHAVFYCPFCGQHLQTPDEIARKQN